MLELLIGEFSNSKWNRFQAAVAFAKQSGNYRELLDAMIGFAQKGGSIEMTFGADVFGADVRGSEYPAIETLISSLKDYPNTRIYLYHERGRIFHPKLYLFSNEVNHEALLIIGSSNWSEGAFLDNIEANVLIRFDLTELQHRECYRNLQTIFAKYWQETE